MLSHRHKGFTLIELLVVISILGILAAALTTQVTRAREMGKAVRCKANLRNLAQAAINCSVETEDYPRAGSAEYYEIGQLNNTYRGLFYEEKGWLSWTGRSPGPLTAASPGTVAKNYGDKTTTYFSITNGTLWAGGYIGHDLDVYVCDVYRAAAKRKSMSYVRWSYVMNGYFMYDDRNHKNYSDWGARKLKNIAKQGNTASLLMFAEIPAYRVSSGKFTESVSTASSDTDGVLETKFKNYSVSSYKTDEIIGFNHLVGKRYVAHVAYADGHVDAVISPTSPTEQKLKDLTFFLCNGVDIPADPSKWATARSEYWSE